MTESEPDTNENEPEPCTVCGDVHDDEHHTDMSSEEIRTELMKALDEADGAMVATARLEDNGVALTAARFADDALDVTQRLILTEAVDDAVGEVVGSDVSRSPGGMAVVTPDEVSELLDDDELREDFQSWLKQMIAADNDTEGRMFQ